MKYAALIAATLLVGCVSNNSTTQPGSGTGSAITNPVLIKTTASLTTTITLNNVKAEDRQKIARYVYAVANGIRTTAESGVISENALNELSQALLSNVNENYRLQVGILVSALQAMALDRLNQAIGDVMNEEKMVAYRALIVSIASGVEDVALQFANGTPRLVIGAASEEFGEIKVPAFRWE